VSFPFWARTTTGTIGDTLVAPSRGSVTIPAGAIVGVAGLVAELAVEPGLDDSEFDGPELLDAEAPSEGVVSAEPLPLADREALPEALVLPPRGVTAAWAPVLPT